MRCDISWRRALARDENLFLDPSDGWQTVAIPALLQRGPFSIAASQHDEAEPVIRIDLDHPRLSREDGEAVFLPHGGNTRYLERAVGALAIPDDVARHIAPLGWEHISLTGDYRWNVESRPDPGQLRPLRTPSSLLAA